MKHAQGPKNRRNRPHLSKFVHCRKYKAFSNVQEALHFDRTSNTCSNSSKEGKFAASKIRSFSPKSGSFLSFFARPRAIALGSKPLAGSSVRSHSACRPGDEAASNYVQAKFRFIRKDLHISVTIVSATAAFSTPTPPPPTPPLLREYKSYDNDTWRVYSMSQNVSFDVRIMRL